MPSTKIHPDNLDFTFGVSNLEQYFIPSLVLVQSILDNNLWANQIQISIFYENWSLEQKNAYKQLIDNFNKSQARNFALLNLFDLSKLKFETYALYHGFKDFRLEGLKFITPISNWVFSIDANELNIRSLEPLILKLNQNYSDFIALRTGNGLRMINPLDGSYINQFPAPFSIFNTKYLYQKNGIIEASQEIYHKLQKTYSKLLTGTVFLNFENIVNIALKERTIGFVNIAYCYPKPSFSVPDSFYFLKWSSYQLSPWCKKFPDNSLKKLWLEYASKSPLSKNFQISHSFKMKFFTLRVKFLIFLHSKIYFSLLHSIGRISPKIFQKFFVFYLKITPKI